MQKSFWIVLLLLLIATCTPKAFANTIVGDTVTLSAVEDYCCAYPSFPSATIGATSPTFGPFPDLSLLPPVTGTPVFEWTVNFQGAGDETLVITATQQNVSSTAGFEDAFTLTNPDWNLINATLISSSFSGLYGPAFVNFTSNSVTFDTNNFGAPGAGDTITAIVQLSSVPEPSTLLMLGTGLLGLGVGLKRKFFAWPG